jgi:hypothetical protein
MSFIRHGTGHWQNGSLVDSNDTCDVIQFLLPTPGNHDRCAFICEALCDCLADPRISPRHYGNLPL